jgi:hypothetical protein
MTRTTTLTTLTVLGLIAASIGSCSYTTAKYETAFDNTVIGDTEAAVIKRFGTPDARLSAGEDFPAYSTGPCKPRCVSSLWWEAPFPTPRGLIAWDVEFDGAGHVVNKWYIFFP